MALFAALAAFLAAHQGAGLPPVLRLAVWVPARLPAAPLGPRPPEVHVQSMPGPGLQLPQARDGGAHANANAAAAPSPSPRASRLADPGAPPGSTLRIPDDWLPPHRLWAAASADGGLILSSASCAYVPFAINLFNAYAALGVTNLLFVAEDEAAHAALRAALGEAHVAPAPWGAAPGAGGSQGGCEPHDYGTAGFTALAHARPLYILYCLARGMSSVTWQDADSVPLARPPRLLRAGADVAMVDDAIRAGGAPEGGSRGSPYFCTCLLAFRRGPASEALLRRWVSHLASYRVNQYAWNDALAELRAGGIPGAEALAWEVLPYEEFPPGPAFDQHRSTAAWAHANHLFGLAAKLEFLQARGLWLAPGPAPACGAAGR